MGSKTRIEWTKSADGVEGSTWNPIRAVNKATSRVGWHCTHVSEGCRNCYAETMNIRLGTGLPFKPGHEKDIELFMDKGMLKRPIQWTRPRSIFVGSMTDLFGEFVPDEWIDDVFAVMLSAPHHTYQILTKRPDRMLTYMADPDTSHRIYCKAFKVIFYEPKIWPLPHVWCGTSVEEQGWVGERLTLLLRTPAVTRFVSAEPLLGPLDMRGYLGRNRFNANGENITPSIIESENSRIHLVITGAESGKGARPMNLDWVRSIRDQCVASNTMFFFKQDAIDGKKIPTPELDGVRWMQLPGQERLI